MKLSIGAKVALVATLLCAMIGCTASVKSHATAPAETTRPTTVLSPVPDWQLAEVQVEMQKTTFVDNVVGVTLDPPDSFQLGNAPMKALAALRLCNLVPYVGGAICAQGAPTKITFALLTDARQLDYQQPYVKTPAWVLEWDNTLCQGGNPAVPADNVCTQHTLINALTGKYISAWMN